MSSAQHNMQRLWKTWTFRKILSLNEQKGKRELVVGGQSRSKQQCVVVEFCKFSSLVWILCRVVFENSILKSFGFMCLVAPLEHIFGNSHPLFRESIALWIAWTWKCEQDVRFVCELLEFRRAEWAVVAFDFRRISQAIEHLARDFNDVLGRLSIKTFRYKISWICIDYRDVIATRIFIYVTFNSLKRIFRIPFLAQWLLLNVSPESLTDSAMRYQFLNFLRHFASINNVGVHAWVSSRFANVMRATISTFSLVIPLELPIYGP